MTDVPARLILRMMPNRFSASSTVMDAVGSSMMMILASRENALAISTQLLLGGGKLVDQRARGTGGSTGFP